MTDKIISKIKQFQIIIFYIAEIVSSIFEYLFVFSNIQLFGLELHGKFSLFLFSQLIRRNE